MRQIDKGSKKFFWFMMLFLSVILIIFNTFWFGTGGNLLVDETVAKRKIQSDVQKFKTVLNDNEIDDADAKFLIEKQEQFNEEADFFSILNSPEEALYDSVDELSQESRITSLQKQMYLSRVKVFEKKSMDNLSIKKLWVYVSGGFIDLVLLLFGAFVIYVYTNPKDKDENEDTTQPSIRVL